jgi:hypothetical protein
MLVIAILQIEAAFARELPSKAYESQYMSKRSQLSRTCIIGSLQFAFERARLGDGGRWPRCGAYARSTGKPCQAPGNGRGSRCKLHGGKSTGPRSPEGIRRLQRALRRRWAAWRAAKARRRARRCKSDATPATALARRPTRKASARISSKG